jgi:hypothetical protein
LAQRNQPINEISALLSGSQVSSRISSMPNMPTIPTTDNAGIINQNYPENAGWQQSQAGMNSILGGLFGLGSSLIMSDRRTKTDIREIGETKDGQPLYRIATRAAP